MGRSNSRQGKPQRARVTSKGHARTMEILVLDENCNPRPVTVEVSVGARAKRGHGSRSRVFVQVPLFELEADQFVGLPMDVAEVEAAGMEVVL